MRASVVEEYHRQQHQAKGYVSRRQNWRGSSLCRTGNTGDKRDRQMIRFAWFITIHILPSSCILSTCERSILPPIASINSLVNADCRRGSAVGLGCGDGGIFSSPLEKARSNLVSGRGAQTQQTNHGACPAYPHSASEVELRQTCLVPEDFCFLSCRA